MYFVRDVIKITVSVNYKPIKTNKYIKNCLFTLILKSVFSIVAKFILITILRISGTYISWHVKVKEIINFVPLCNIVLILITISNDSNNTNYLLNLCES